MLLVLEIQFATERTATARSSCMRDVSQRWDGFCDVYMYIHIYFFYWCNPVKQNRFQYHQTILLSIFDVAILFRYFQHMTKWPHNKVYFVIPSDVNLWNVLCNFYFDSILNILFNFHNLQYFNVSVHDISISFINKSYVRVHQMHPHHFTTHHGWPSVFRL